MPVHLLFYSYFHDCVILIIVLSHIQTHVQNIQMARKTKQTKLKCLVDTKCKSNPLFLDLYFNVNHTSWCFQNENRLLVITNGHLINEQILRTPSKCIALTVQNGL